ncbi:MAG: hypothetical protein IH617_02495, partial [Hydrogenophaga sp.]|nr:hypothetical protein [Hydrogenophaga sp.]
FKATRHGAAVANGRRERLDRVAPFWSALIIDANGVVFLNLPGSLLPDLEDQKTHLR